MAIFTMAHEETTSLSGELWERLMDKEPIELRRNDCSMCVVHRFITDSGLFPFTTAATEVSR